ncbi:MAG TPA: hypothetical protein VFW76_13610 [Ktedonobacterales bacterium]|nr:hypothetical protein [Ktedonobacterales bacterium]
MGWFSRKNQTSDNRGKQAADEPFVADDQIVARVAHLMAMWNDAVGDDARMRATASGISSTAGVDDHFLMSAAWIDNPAVLHERPWQMLAAVALRAAQQGDYVLAARIFGFTSFWGTQIAPHLRPADWFDMRLEHVPPAIDVNIASTALGALRHLADDQIIFSNATGSVTAADLRIAAANLLQKRGES